MLKLLFVARRAWKLIPREHRRTVRRNVTKTVRTHGPTVARNLRQTVNQTRKAR
jgi:hypothetical protein